MAPVGGPIHLTDEHARYWFERMVDPGSATDYFRLILDHEDRPVGEVSFHRLDAEQMRAELNVKIAHPERGKGYASAAMRLLLDYFFNEFGGRVMIDHVALDNYGGQQALMRFGFEHDPGVEGVFGVRMTRERFHALYEG